MQTIDSLTGQLRLYSGGHREYGDSMLRAMFPRLRQIAVGRLSRERHPPFTPTELIGETWLTRLNRGGWRIDDREHFFGIASRAMKFVLTDAARRRRAHVRGRGVEHVSIEEATLELRSDTPNAEEVLAIGMLMEELEKVNPQIASIVHLHYIVGFRLEEISAETGLTLRQVRHLWQKGKIWLATRLLSKHRRVRESLPGRGRSV